MDPVYVDLHIHTSDDPDALNSDYDLDTLKTKLDEFAAGCEYLISLTDHNVINKPVYLRAVEIFDYILLGVELHIRNYKNAKPYHCHIYFNLNPITEAAIDDINERLDILYPRKKVSNSEPSIPRLEEVMNQFEIYEFLILPHGGQNHSTFDKSIPPGVHFDNTLERNIYYNHFDGFTARTTKGVDQTLEYFARLGIKDFVNLVTATDNYEPSKYPQCKADRDDSTFTPTWMLARPTFNGLRLSLSESSRLCYGMKPEAWSECIQRAKLNNDHADIDVHLRPGLNVIIGGSSSGKSLLADSIYRHITGNFENSPYTSTVYRVTDLQVYNPSGQHPHYLDQSYITRICDIEDKDNDLDDIPILRNVFPSDSNERQEIADGLSKLGYHLRQLMQAVQEIEKLQGTLKRIPILSRLIVTETIKGNPLRSLVPDDATIERFEYTPATHRRHVGTLEEIDRLLARNPLVTHDRTLISRLKEELDTALVSSSTENRVREVIEVHKSDIDKAQEDEDKEITTKRTQFEQLLESLRKYARYQREFDSALRAISEFAIKSQTKEIQSQGHTLFIDNEFELTQDKFLEAVNSLLKSTERLNTFEALFPEALFESRFSKQKPKVQGYEDFGARIRRYFDGLDTKKYRIITKEGKDFDRLSAGWKTSVILDLILGWDEDTAPLIIDQPEDNLATGYINGGLLEAIKRCKSRKQVILVSHNATIPMLADAQNVVMCRNDDQKITIRSSPLEGYIDGALVVDLVAETTDGGKASVKKRVKKYDLKNFRGTDEVSFSER